MDPEDLLNYRQKVLNKLDPVPKSEIRTGFIMEENKMSHQEKINLYKQTIETLGEDHQIRKMVEECAEAIQAIMKYLNKRSPETRAHLCQELADVEVVGQQMRIIFGDDEIDKTKDFKLKRLSKLIGGEK